MKKYYIYISYSGKTVGCPWEYLEEWDLDAALESVPNGADTLTTGTKQELITKFNLDESDFEEE